MYNFFDTDSGYQDDREKEQEEQANTMYYCCGMTSKGIMPHNEDAFFIHKTVLTQGSLTTRLPAPFLCGVSDGVSGEQSGELASKLCLTLMSNIRFSKKISMERKLMEVHKLMAQYGAERSETHNMQATFCGIGVDESDRLHFFNVGDSRLYRYRGGMVRQISTDQSLVQMLYQEGTITQEEKKTHRYRNIISPVMGNLSSVPKPDITHTRERMEYGDLLILCTDGLSDYVTPMEMEDILALPQALPKRLSSLIDFAIAQGGKDNVTVVAIAFYDA